MKMRLLALLVVGLVAVSLVPGSVYAVSVPINGCFTTNFNGWGRFSSDTWWSAAGHGTCGAAQLRGFDEGIISNAFVPASGSSLTFWAMSGGTNPFRIRIYNFDTNLISESADQATTTSYAQWTVDMSPYAGGNIAVGFMRVGGSTDIFISDVNVTNASNQSGQQFRYFNGRFIGSAAGWVFQDSSKLSFDGTAGHAAPGSLSKTFGYWGSFYSLSRNVVVDDNTVSVWVYQASGADKRVRIDVMPMDGSAARTGIFDSGWIAPVGWTQKTADVTAYNGKEVFWFVGLENADTTFSADDFCPLSGCIDAPTPTPTTLATATAGPTLPPGGFPYGAGTPLPIDWSNFPTPVPYPTFPGFPTPIYGAGTPMPVIINGGSPIPVYLVTPFPTQIPYPTRLATWTPIPTHTPIPTLPNTGSVPTVVQVAMPYATLSFENPGAKPNLVFGGSDTTPPVVFELSHLVMGPLSLNLSSVNLPNITVTINYYYISSFSYLGIPLLTGFSGVGAVWLFVWIVKRVRTR